MKVSKILATDVSDILIKSKTFDTIKIAMSESGAYL